MCIVLERWYVKTKKNIKIGVFISYRFLLTNFEFCNYFYKDIGFKLIKLKNLFKLNKHLQ